jgi:outer membrane protein assembly factor BamB
MVSGHCLSLKTLSALAAALGVLLACAGVSSADPWPGWRGPTGQGQTSDKDLPLSWGGPKQQHVLWKAALIEGADKVRLDQNQSSPVVWGERVFVTASWWPDGVGQDRYPEHHVVCFAAADGKRLWDATVPPGPWLLKDLRGGYTAPTPAADGERVYVLFGSSVLAALDVKGKLLWRKEIAPHFFDVAIGTSPVVHGETVLVMCEQIREHRASRLLAFDRKTGELKWERKRPAADWTHSTPVLAPVKGRSQLLVAGADGPVGLNPDNGEPLWWVKTAKRTGDTVSPVLAGGLVYCDSGRGGPGVAVDPTGTGDVSKTHLRWTAAVVPEGFSSPVAVGDHLYRLHNPETLTCRELATGKLVYAERLQGVSTSASPVATPQGHIYFASAGRSYVIQAGPKLEVLGANDLGDGSPASPAVADGRLYLKGRRYLYCVGKK